MTSERVHVKTASRAILISGILVAVIVAAGGVWFAPLLFDLNVPGTSGTDRVNGISSVRQAALLVAGGIIAAATLLQTSERDRFTRRKYEADIADALQRFDDLRAQRQLEEKRYNEQRRLDDERLDQQRKLDEERLAQQRNFDTEKELRGRFVAATQLLTGLEAVTKTAGAYAMAALADEWIRADRPTESQVCIDVLCAFIRNPGREAGASATINPTSTSTEESLVRANIFRIIADHLTPDISNTWQSMTFDFSRCLIDYQVDFMGVHVQSGTRILFHETEFRKGDFNAKRLTVSLAGTIDFSKALFSGGKLDLSESSLEGELLFNECDLSAGAIDIDHGSIAGHLSFNNAKFSGCRVSFFSTQVKRPASLFFLFAVITGSAISFFTTQFHGGHVVFRFAQLKGGIVDFDSATFSGTTLWFQNAYIDPGVLDFETSVYEKGTLAFSNDILNSDFGASEFTPPNFATVFDD